MTWAEFEEHYKANLGHRSTNYTQWVILTTSQVNRIAEFFAYDESLQGEWTASGRTYDGRNVTLTFKHNLGCRGGLFDRQVPVPFVTLTGDRIWEDGFAYPHGNKLLMDRKHLAFTLLDSDTGFGMRRGSLMLLPEGSVHDPPVEEEADE